MRSFRKIITILMVLAVTVSLAGCGWLDGLLSGGDVPTPAFGIPEALTAENSGSRTTVSGTYYHLFEPFRASLRIADDILEMANDIIDEINENYVPDTFEGDSDDGYLRITTDDSREDYSRRIEFSDSATAEPYLQISYTPGSAEGEVIYKDSSADAGELEVLKVYYNASTAILKGWLTVKEEADGSYPTSLYFNALKNSSDYIEIDGGVAYNFLWDADTSTFHTTYTSERAYMFRSFADTDGAKAQVGLYFPLADVADFTTDPEAYDIQQSFLEILYTWLNLNDFDYDSKWGTTAINSQETFNSFVLAATADDLGDLAFILSLTNPIAYSATLGYEGNGSIPSEYSNLGTLSDISFSMTPVQIAALAPDSSTFDFRED